MCTPIGSIASVSGASRATIQLNDATENFARTVQRFRVKLAAEPNQPLAKLPRVGAWVETTTQAARERAARKERRASLRVATRSKLGSWSMSLSENRFALFRDML